KRDWRSWLARFPDTEEVTGSNPVSRTGLLSSVIHADVAQLARAPPCQGGGRGFESRHPLCLTRVLVENQGPCALTYKAPAVTRFAHVARLLRRQHEQTTFHPVLQCFFS